MLQLPDIKATTTIEGRVYHTPLGDLPSVTTVLKESLDHSALDAWRARVGDDEASKVSTQASVRGTEVHNLAEKYLSNDPQWKRGAMPVNIDTFSSVRKDLDRRVGIIYGLEVPLYSRRLYTAGRTDLICQWDGIDSVVDFKTSRRVKKEEHILGYFIQKTCYSLMLEEMIGKILSQIVTVMMVDFEDPIIFIKRRDDYKEVTERIFLNYAAQKSSI